MKWFKNNFIFYQVFLIVCLLIAISIVEFADVVLPVYIVLAILPYIFGIRINNRFFLLYAYISFAYLVIGLVSQNYYYVIKTFATRIFQFIALMAVLNNKSINNFDWNIKKLLSVVMIAETALSVNLLLSGEGLRAIAGHQPVGGNLSITVLPLIIWSYYNESRYSEFIFKSSFVLLFWIVMSGTRGYMLIFAFSMLPIYIDYLFFKTESEKQKKNRAVLMLALIVSIIIMGLIFSDVLHDIIFEKVRIDKGTGIRSLENQTALGFFNNTELKYKLFGTGLGANLSSIPGYLESVSQNMTSQWAYYNYIHSTGTAFHNMFANILVLQGALGILLIFGLFISVLNVISRAKYNFKAEKYCYYLYWAGFFIMNYFRWSCDCGITEMILFAAALSKSRTSIRNYYISD